MKRSENSKSSIIIIKSIISAIIIAAVILAVCIFIDMKDCLMERIKDKIPPGFPIEITSSEQAAEGPKEFKIMDVFYKKNLWRSYEI